MCSASKGYKQLRFLQFPYFCVGNKDSDLVLVETHIRGKSKQAQKRELLSLRGAEEKEGVGGLQAQLLSRCSDLTLTRLCLFLRLSVRQTWKKQGTFEAHRLLLIAFRNISVEENEIRVKKRLELEAWVSCDALGGSLVSGHVTVSHLCSILVHESSEIWRATTFNLI